MEFSFKNKKRTWRDQCEKYLLVSPDMKLPHNISKFLSVGANNEC